MTMRYTNPRLLSCTYSQRVGEGNTEHLKDLSRAIPDSGGGSSERLFLLSENTISADFDQFSAKLFVLDHSAI